LIFSVGNRRYEQTDSLFGGGKFDGARECHGSEHW
jgi:hypothetical protein